jgi:hypothetical protein
MMISLAATTPPDRGIEAAGHDPDQVLRPLGLTRSMFVDPHGFIASSDSR